ncbi:MAG: helicase C-terminal domain-containing protein, partial [Sarcina sp.]
PRVTTSFKQCFGRLIRTELDYGCFIIFDSGESTVLKNKIFKEYKNIQFINSSMELIIDYLKSNYKKWNMLNLESIIIQSEESLLNFINDNKSKLRDKSILLKELNEFYNKEFNHRQLTNKISLILDNNFIKARYKDGSILEIHNKSILKNAIKNIIK